MIQVSYTFCPGFLSGKQLERLMLSLPSSVCHEASQIVDQKRKIGFIAGRLMLKEMLPIEFDDVERNNFGKPYLPNGYQFNISHSESLVVCAISNKQRLGVDSEKVKKVNLQDYASSLNEEDRYILQRSSNKMKTFHRIWTQKESLMKADGRGVFIDMKDVFLKNMEGFIKGENTRWRLISFTVVKDYEISVCHEWGKEDVRLRRLDHIWNQAIQHC